MEKIGLILTANFRDGESSYIWDYVKENIDTYKSFYENFFIVICGNGKFPEWTKEYNVCNNKKLDVSHNGIERFINILPKALEITKDAICEKTLISPSLWYTDNKNLLKSKLSIVGDLSNKKLYSEFVYGKTETLYKVFTKKQWTPLLSEERNLYQIFENVIGKDNLKNFTISKTEAQINERFILSRNISRKLEWKT